MTSDLRQVTAGVCMLIAMVAVPLGLIMTAIGCIASLQDPDAGPTCNGEVMTPGMQCWSFGDDSAGVTSYEQAVEAHRNGIESANGFLPGGIVVLVIGIGAALVFREGTRSSTGTGSTTAAPSAMPFQPRPQRHTGPAHGLGPRAVGQSQDRGPSFTELHSHAASALGQGDLDTALYWNQMAANAGDPVAMNNLARLLQDRVSRQSWPRRWLRRYRNSGDLIEAGLWFRRAAVAGNPDAMGNLAALLHKDGNLNEAELWHRRAIEAGPQPQQVDTASGGQTPSLRTPEQFATVAPGRSANTPADEMDLLLTMVAGSHTTAKRLIDFEQRKDPAAERATSIRRAIERLREDLRRQG